MKYLIIIIIIQSLVIAVYLWAKARTKKLAILSGLDINTLDNTIKALEIDVKKKDKLIKILDKKLKAVNDEKEPDTMEQLVNMFNNVTSTD